MATTTIVTLTDSINGSTEGVETVVFYHPMTGIKMEIELNEQNRAAFGTHLTRMGKYFDAAVVVEVPVEPSKPKAAKNTETTKMREWAKANGFAIGDRGRISAEIQTAYAAAQEQIVSEPVDQVEAPAEVSEPMVDSAETNLSDAEILELMAEIEAEHGQVTIDSLAEAVDEAAEQE
jgi:hypothetical protein